MQLTVMMRMASEWIHSGKGFVQGRNISKINVLPRSEKSGLFSFLGDFFTGGGHETYPPRKRCNCRASRGFWQVKKREKVPKNSPKSVKKGTKRTSPNDTIYAIIIHVRWPPDRNTVTWINGQHGRQRRGKCLIRQTAHQKSGMSGGFPHWNPAASFPFGEQPRFAGTASGGVHTAAVYPEDSFGRSLP